LHAPHWTALAPDAPLRRWRLLEIASGPPLTQTMLRIDERVLHHLVGITHLDSRLLPLLRPAPGPSGLPPAPGAISAPLAAPWRHAAPPTLPVHLCGPAVDTIPIAATAAALVGTGAAQLHADLLPTAPGELETLLTLWRRESVLSNLGVLVI